MVLCRSLKCWWHDSQFKRWKFISVAGTRCLGCGGGVACPRHSSAVTALLHIQLVVQAGMVTRAGTVETSSTGQCETVSGSITHATRTYKHGCK